MQTVSVGAMGAQISSFSFSPSGRIMAVESSGEGHPLLDIYNTAGLAADNDIDYLGTLDPYPGWVSVAGWEGDDLLLEADVPLHEDFDQTAEYDNETIYTLRWSLGTPGLELIRAISQNTSAAGEADLESNLLH